MVTSYIDIILTSLQSVPVVIFLLLFFFLSFFLFFFQNSTYQLLVDFESKTIIQELYCAGESSTDQVTFIFIILII